VAQNVHRCSSRVDTLPLDGTPYCLWPPNSQDIMGTSGNAKTALFTPLLINNHLTPHLFTPPHRNHVLVLHTNHAPGTKGQRFQFILARQYPHRGDILTLLQSRSLQGRIGKPPVKMIDLPRRRAQHSSFLSPSPPGKPWLLNRVYLLGHLLYSTLDLTAVIGPQMGYQAGVADQLTHYFGLSHASMEVVIDEHPRGYAAASFGGKGSISGKGMFTSTTWPGHGHN